MNNDQERLHALDAVRAGALLLGIVLHGTMSFMPALTQMGWPIVDNSPSELLQFLFFLIHIFRMTAFFVIAGFFAHLLLQRRGAAGFIKDRSRRVLIPLVVGWPIVAPLVIGVFIWAAMTADTRIEPPASSGTPLAVPLMHFWFLYVLALLYVVVLAVRQIAQRMLDANALRTRLDSAVALLMRSHLAPLVLAVPLGVCLATYGDWGVYEGIPTPDQSLIPNLPAFVGYGVAFTFGWLLERQRRLLAGLERTWVGYLAAAVVMTGTIIALASINGMPLAASALAYAIGSWLWTLALIGAAMRFLSSHRPAIRYLADSSYWIYLVHLPVVFALQQLMSKWPLHWSMKFPLILGIATVLLLASYRYFVRNTAIGELLNGRRYDDEKRSSLPAAPRHTEQAEVTSLASLRGARKRYGKTLALDGLDLEIARGELVAVLGPNGAGKSTAIALLLGLEQPDAGEVRLFGDSPRALAARRRTGVMMQEVARPAELRVGELLQLTASYYAAPLTPDAAMQITRTTALAERPYGKLSGGQKRQVQFAMAICGRPQLLFLDEPTVGLDIKAREAMWQTIRELVRGGCAIVLTTHYLEEAEALADKVVVMAKGKVISSGSVNEIRSLVSRRRIECITSISTEVVRSWPEVDEVRRSSERIEITTAQAEAVVRRLLAADESLAELEVRRAGLSEAFTELTQEAA